MDSNIDESQDAVPKLPQAHAANGTLPIRSAMESRNQQERENLYAAIQSTGRKREPVDLDRPESTYTSFQPPRGDWRSAHTVAHPFPNGVEEERTKESQVDVTNPTPLAMSRASSPYTRHPTVDFDGLSWPSVGTRARKEATPKEKEERLAKLSGAIRTILECVGEDPDREGLLETPKRYAEAMLFFTKGYEENLREVVNGAVFHEDHDELVIVKDIEIFTMCEHHLVPFTGKMHIGYIPNRRVLGLSKLARIAEMFARRLQVQERLTKQVALALSEVLQPQGVAVVMESSHLCMVMRGVQKTTSSTVTSCMLGAMRSRAKTREEFLSLLNRR